MHPVYCSHLAHPCVANGANVYCHAPASATALVNADFEPL